MLNDTTARQEYEERRKEKTKEDRRQNNGFTQVYQRGWWRLRELMETNRPAARLYMFLAENMDTAGVLVATRETIAEAMEVSVKSVSRYTKALEEAGALVVMRMGPGANAYALNPEEVWKAWEKNKPYAAFHSKTLVGKAENRNVKRRLTHILNGKKPADPEPPLPFDA